VSVLGDETETRSILESTGELGARPRGPRTALVVRGRSGVEVSLLVSGRPLVVGRAPAEGLRIEDRSLSREHARFELLPDGRVAVRDLGSKNGTYFERRRVDAVAVEIGDSLRLGGVAVEVQALGASGGSLGVHGEASLRQRVEDELTRARQFQRPFSLLLVRFGRVTRTAHGAADASLCPEPAGAWLEIVRERIRPVDPLAMHGPDAFQILLPETGSDEASTLARVLAAPLPDPDVKLLVGVAPYPTAGRTVDELFESSSEAIRRATPDAPVARGGSGSGPLTALPSGASGLIAGERMQAVVETVERVAGSRIPVILHGETGTGKEVLAALLHERGPRKRARMVRVNCGAIPKELVESTLFGHERGAFTGANQQQRGIFEEADGGTVFLDELGELPAPAQVALLRVLETGAFSRVGSHREVRTDVRLVAATHRDLEALVEEGTFRADLFYRLSGVVIEIPPLRERADEIEPLAMHFLAKANKADGRAVEGFVPDALELLRRYAWPGNVRELKNAVERAVVVCRGGLIAPVDLPARVRAMRGEGEGDRASDPGRISDPGRVSEPTLPSGVAPPLGAEGFAGKDLPAQAGPVRGKVNEYEMKILRETLEASGWNRAEAARRLGMPVRTLSYRMKVLGIQKPG